VLEDFCWNGHGKGVKKSGLTENRERAKRQKKGSQDRCEVKVLYSGAGRNSSFSKVSKSNKKAGPPPEVGKASLSARRPLTEGEGDSERKNYHCPRWKLMRIRKVLAGAKRCAGERGRCLILLSEEAEGVFRWEKRGRLRGGSVAQVLGHPLSKKKRKSDLLCVQRRKRKKKQLPPPAANSVVRRDDEVVRTHVSVI